MGFLKIVLIGFGSLFLLETAVTVIAAAVFILGDRREQAEINELERMYEAGQ